MRYRPFGRSGMAVSALSLKLCGDDDCRSAQDWLSLVHAAFEEGVNAFELVRPSPSLLQGLAEGVQAVRRALLFVALRVEPGLRGQALPAWVREAARSGGLGAFDLVCLEASEVEGQLGAAQALKDEGLARRLAVAGPGEALSDHAESRRFEAVATPFNLLSGWRERLLVRGALERQMGVIACDPCPGALAALVDQDLTQARPGLMRRAAPLAGVGTYAVLSKTHGWSLEQICVGYALTEPAVATVQAEVSDPEHLRALAEAADRDLPSAVSAQIEMARFSSEREDRRRRA